MSNTMRWRYGETNSVMLPVAVGHAVQIGDLLYLDNGSVKPASSQVDQGSLAANQETFHDAFVGVAMQCSPATSADMVRVATTGVFEFACVAAAHAVGELLGSAEDAGGTQLQTQWVISVAMENLAVGRCVKPSTATSERVLVDIVSTAVRGGPQPAA